MILLAFETSCDDTSIALFRDTDLICMETESQIKIHNKTGGVVPEVAAREHANSIFSVLEIVLTKANLELQDIDYIAVTVTPGLIPSLLTGITVAKTLGNIYNKRVLEINHIEAHIFANYLERKEDDISYPLVCLTVSWGHNEIYYKKHMFHSEKLWATTDDSAGEAFDKVAKMMGLSYPGWPIISDLATQFSWEASSKNTPMFPRVWLEKKWADFSFSGLKSAVKREIDKRGELTNDDKIQIAFEFQNAVIEVLAFKLVSLWLQKWVKQILLAGWVGANTLLREEIARLAIKEKLNFLYPKKLIYCMDNAAMIWILAYYKIKKWEE